MTYYALSVYTTFAVGLFSGVTPAHAEFNYPGGVVELEFDKQTQELPDIRFGIHEPAIIELKQKWRVLVGIDLATLPGEYVVYFRRSMEGSRGEFRSIQVRRKPVHNTQANDANASQTSATTPVRTFERWSEIDFSNTQQPSLPLQLPLLGQWSDTFGQQVIDPDSGTIIQVNAVSLTTTERANVVAPQTAIVSRVITDEKGGSTVFLDHGRGLLSMIDGLVDVTVAAGNGVNAGAVLGVTPISQGSLANEGSTIVWQTQLNKALIDPFILTQLSP